MIAFQKKAGLKQLIETNTIKSNQNFLTPTQKTIIDQYSPYYTSRSLCCQQFLKTTTFTSTPERPLQFFTKSLAIVTMSSTY